MHVGEDQPLKVVLLSHEHHKACVSSWEELGKWLRNSCRSWGRSWGRGWGGAEGGETMKIYSVKKLIGKMLRKTAAKENESA